MHALPVAGNAQHLGAARNLNRRFHCLHWSPARCICLPHDHKVGGELEGSQVALELDRGGLGVTVVVVDVHLQEGAGSLGTLHGPARPDLVTPLHEYREDVLACIILPGDDCEFFHHAIALRG